MLEILPSISAGSDRPRNGFIKSVDGGKSSSGIRPFLWPWPLGWPSWACFKCCFILSGLENSFWHTEQGKTFLAAPSWYKKACLWKLYLFLKCLVICTRSHSTHLFDILIKPTDFVFNIILLNWRLAWKKFNCGPILYTAWFINKQIHYSYSMESLTRHGKAIAEMLDIFE